MSDDNKKILLSIDLDVSTLLQSAAEAKQVVDDLKKKQKELTDAGQDNTVEFQNIAAKLREATGAYRDINKEIDNTVKSNKAASGSLTEMKANLSNLTREYNNLSKEQRDNKDVGGALQKQIKGLSDDLKTAESAIGNNSRNVGNYAESMKMLPGPLKAAGDGVTGLGETFKALLANPIVLIIAAIALALKTMYDAFKDTKQGADLFSEGAAALKAIMNELVQPLIKVAEWLVSAFKDPQKALSDLGSMIKENIVNRVNGLLELLPALGKAISLAFSGEFSEAAKVAGDAIVKVGTGINDASGKIKQMGKNISDAAKQAYELEKANIALEDSQRQANVENEKNNALIKELIIQSKNKTLADNERIGKLKEASALELENSKVQIDLATKELETLQKINALKAKGRELTDEQEQAEADARTKIYQLQGASAELQEKILNRQDALEQSIRDKNVKAAEEAAKAKDKLEADAQKTLEQRLKDREAIEKIMVLDSIKGSQEEYENEIALLRAQANTELAQKNLTNAQKLLIEKNYQVAVEQLTQNRIKAQEENAKKELDKVKEGLAERDAVNRASLAAETVDEMRALNDRYEKGELSYAKYLNELKKMELDAKNKSAALKAQELREQAALEKQDSARQVQLEAEADQIELQSYIDTEVKKREEAKRTEEIQMQSLQNYLGTAQNVFGGLASLFEQGSDEYKAFAILQATASTASGAIGAFSQAAQTYPAPYGEILGALMAGVIVAEGVEQIAKIEALEDGGLIFPKAERGMIIGGEPHSRGGTKFYGSDGTRFEAEKDEMLAIVNKRSVGTIGKLNALNMLKGGNNFFDNGGLTHLADGGFAMRAMSAPVIQNANNKRNIDNAIQNMPQQIVLVEDINSAQGKQVKLKSRAEL